MSRRSRSRWLRPLEERTAHPHACDHRGYKDGGGADAAPESGHRWTGTVADETPSSAEQCRPDDEPRIDVPPGRQREADGEQRRASPEDSRTAVACTAMAPSITNARPGSQRP